MEKEWKSGEAIWHMKQAELNALDVAAMNKLNEIVDVARLRQRVAELEREVATARLENIIKYGVSHPEMYKSEYEERLEAERDELLAAAEAIEINAEECLDFDDCSAMLVSIDAYHKLIEAIASVKEK